MSENGEIYTAGKNFPLLPAVTAVTNSTSGAESEGSVNTLSNTFYIIFNSEYFQWHIAVVGQSQRVVSILFQILFFIMAELDDSSRQQHPHPAVIFALALYKMYEYIHHDLIHGLKHSPCFGSGSYTFAMFWYNYNWSWFRTLSHTTWTLLFHYT